MSRYVYPREVITGVISDNYPIVAKGLFEYYMIIEAGADIDVTLPNTGLVEKGSKVYIKNLEAATTLAAGWVTATDYYVGDYVSNGGGPSYYKCIADHTSSAAGAVGDEPGVGDTWETKWVLVGVYDVTIKPGGALVDFDTADVTLTSNQSKTLVTDGTDWYTV